jgi:hypothetical protein
MATPRVFVSSTYYDLKYIRENLRYFIKTIGYEPTLSEDGNVFYNPKKHTHDSCLNEVPSCQIFILIIGGRFGGQFKASEKSITNEEYLEAVKQKIPVFALVEQAVFQEHHVFNENFRNNTPEINEKIRYPSVDNPKVFSFIDEVRKNSVNNAVVPFRDFSDIEDYLRKQWAGMMFNFLHESIEESRVADTLEKLTEVSSKIEILSELILNSVGSEKSQIVIKLYDAIMRYEVSRDLAFFKINLTPDDLIRYSSLDEFLDAHDKAIEPYPPELEDEDSEWSLSSRGYAGKLRFKHMRDDYEKLRKEATEILEKNGWDSTRFINDEHSK